jgi:hypothetical protein
MNQLQIQPSKEIVVSSFLLKPSGLEGIGNPSFEDWTKCGQFLKNSEKAVHFWIGDWVNYGEHNYGDKYTQEINETNFSYSTISQDRWVASRIPFNSRLQNVPFSHHVEVADLVPEDRDRFLKQALDESIPRDKFRKLVRRFKLGLYLPEMSEEQLDQIMEKDRPGMVLVQPIVELMITLEEELSKLEVNELDSDSRDYFLSQLKKMIGKSGEVLIKYAKPVQTVK